MSWTWLLYPLGITNVSGHPYAFWSGSGSVLLPPLITLTGIAALYAWHHQCHQHRCLRVVRHAPAGSERRCHRHPRPAEPSAPDPVLAALIVLSHDVRALTAAIRETGIQQATEEP